MTKTINPSSRGRAVLRSRPFRMLVNSNKNPPTTLVQPFLWINESSSARSASCLPRAVNKKRMDKQPHQSSHHKNKLRRDAWRMRFVSGREGTKLQVFRALFSDERSSPLTKLLQIHYIRSVSARSIWLMGLFWRTLKSFWR